MSVNSASRLTDICYVGKLSGTEDVQVLLKALSLRHWLLPLAERANAEATGKASEDQYKTAE